MMLEYKLVLGSGNIPEAAATKLEEEVKREIGNGFKIEGQPFNIPAQHNVERVVYTLAQAMTRIK